VILISNIGIALGLLRVQRQSVVVGENGGFLLPDLDGAVRARINPIPGPLDFPPGRPSPLSSPSLGACILRFLSGNTHDEDQKLLSSAIDFALVQPMTVKLHGHDMGSDELLYGRAGLLWALLEIKRHCRGEVDEVFLKLVYEAVPRLVGLILDAGRRGAEQHASANGSHTALPLMWPWVDHFHSLGAMHGMTGILSVLVDPDLRGICPSVESSYLAIADTITGFCKLCIENKGELPMSVPAWPSASSTVRYQICHGTPGLLLLLACVKKNNLFTQFRTDVWGEAVQIGSDAVWKYGLLSKGGGLCHGITGNALPLIMLYNPLDSSTDRLLSYGLAMLMEARETLPFSRANLGSEATKNEREYRMPDHPYSLFEGLAGTVCAWLEACIVIEAKLKIMARGGVDDNEEYSRYQHHRLGFPCIGGGG
jgi:hypothetical protein